MFRLKATLVGLLVVLAGQAHKARACSSGTAPAPTAIPRAGTTGVSTATSIVVVSLTEPFGVGVTANGQVVPVSGWTALGAGVDQTGGPTSFWQLRLGASMLAGSADYVVSLPGAAATLTSFSTAAGYDKAPGIAPNLRGLHLWRVRYPIAQIASGNCVFAEYAGFLTVDYDPATIPNTTAGSVVQSFRLAPDTGGTAQTFVYTGDAPYAGLAPSGDDPAPLAPWQPDLDPTRRYCLTVSAIGDGDLARLATNSNQICADVVQLSAAGAPPSPAGGGCSMSGTPASWFALLVSCAAVWTLGRRRRQVD